MFAYPLLDDATRAHMLAEFVDDSDAGRVYLSDRLSPAGRVQFPSFLREAIESGDSGTLAAKLSAQGIFLPTFQRKKPKGGFTDVTMPVDAHITLGDGEFNRYYCRAVCIRAATEHQDRVRVVRGKAVLNPRAESEARIGRLLTASTVLADLRINPGLDTILGLPPGPNSGLTLTFP